MIHYRHYCDSAGWGTIPCGRLPSLCDRDSGHSYSDGAHVVTCHRCLEVMVEDGEVAVARILELDRLAANASEAEGPSSGSDEAVKPGSSPVGRSDTIDESTVLVHAEGGDCHGTALQNERCPDCGMFPDMQGRGVAWWPRYMVKYSWRDRELNGDSW